MENLFTLTTDLHRELTVVNTYCKVYINEEGIYNISSLLKNLELKSLEIHKIIYYLIEKENEITPDFIAKIKPLDYSEFIVED